MREQQVGEKCQHWELDGPTLASTSAARVLNYMAQHFRHQGE